MFFSYTSAYISCPVGRVWDASQPRTVSLEVTKGIYPKPTVLPHCLNVTVIYNDTDTGYHGKHKEVPGNGKELHGNVSNMVANNNSMKAGEDKKETVANSNNIMLNSTIKDTDVVDFSVCVPPVFNNYSDVMEFVEMVEVGRMFGAKRFTLYNLSIGADLEPYIQYYQRLGVVEVLPWNIPWQDKDNKRIHDNIHYFGEVVALNECMYRNMYRTQFLSMTDLDEVVVPKTFDDWGTLMKYTKSAISYDFQVSSVHVYYYALLLVSSSQYPVVHILLWLTIQ